MNAYLPDPGADFAAYYPDPRPVTVESVNPDTGATLASAANVPAARLLEVGNTAPARGGEVGFGACEFWFRCDGLSFTPKPRDTVTEDPGGAAEIVWIIDECAFTGVGGARALCRCKVTRAR